MKSISNPRHLANLVERLGRLRPDTPRRWGTLTSAEMLCHLGDASASVMARGSSESVMPDASAAEATPDSSTSVSTPGSGDARRRPLFKWIALSSPLAWPHGLKTPAWVDPRADGTRPADFEQDRLRAIRGLQALAKAPAGTLAASHGVFGPMTVKDWHRWAYRHTNHHLSQFGL